MTTIRITDLGCTAIYEVRGARYVMIATGGCSDVLHDAGIGLTESMDNDMLRTIVWDEWTRCYDGDPIENCLKIRIQRG